MEHTPHNPFSGTVYQGKNATTLASASTTREFATFLQWKRAGFNIKKGEHGHIIYAFPEVERKNAAGKIEKGRAPRSYTVFSREQVAN